LEGRSPKRASDQNDRKGCDQDKGQRRPIAACENTGGGHIMLLFETVHDDIFLIG
jgi:hypothetical protein